MCSWEKLSDRSVCKENEAEVQCEASDTRDISELIAAVVLGEGSRNMAPVTLVRQFSG